MKQWLAGMVKLVVWMAGAFAFIQSVATAIRWWRGDIVMLTREDGFWLALLPLMLYLYFRQSVFGCKQPACLLPPEEQPPHSPQEPRDEITPHDPHHAGR